MFIFLDHTGSKPTSLSRGTLRFHPPSSGTVNPKYCSASPILFGSSDKHLRLFITKEQLEAKYDRRMKTKKKKGLDSDPPPCQQWECCVFQRSVQNKLSGGRLSAPTTTKARAAFPPQLQRRAEILSLAVLRSVQGLRLNRLSPPFFFVSFQSKNTGKMSKLTAGFSCTED